MGRGVVGGRWLDAGAIERLNAALAQGLCPLDGGTQAVNRVRDPDGVAGVVSNDLDEGVWLSGHRPSNAYPPAPQGVARPARRARALRFG